MEGLRLVTEQIIPGRWDEARLPNELEMKATTVLAITIDTASAKIRTGAPGDDDADYDLPVWAGVLPARMMFDDPITDPAMKMELSVSDSVTSRIIS